LLDNIYLNQGIEPLADIIGAYRSEKVLLVRGGSSFSSMQDVVMGVLKGGGVNTDEFVVSGFGPNSSIILELVSLCEESRPDMILAVGGGKVLDTAKAGRVLLGRRNFLDSIKKSEVGKGEIPLVAIPTTAGTGAEVTQFAVVYIDNTKYSLSHPLVRPNHAVIDGAFIIGASEYVAASAQFDALSQAIEAYWSILSTRQSQEYSKKSIKLLLNHLDTVCNHEVLSNQNDLVAASLYSGRAISIARTTAPHSLSYALTSHYDVPHGHAVALMLPMFFEENLSQQHELNDKRGRGYLTRTMHELFQMMECNSGSECKQKWKQLMKSVGLETSFNKLGVRNEKDVQFLSASVNQERLMNHPVVLNSERVVAMLRDEVF